MKTNQFNYLNQFLPSLELLRVQQPREFSQEEYNKFHFGKAYLGHGFVKCDFCLMNAVEIKGYFEQHICVDCQQEISSN